MPSKRNAASSNNSPAPASFPAGAAAKAPPSTTSATQPAKTARGPTTSTTSSGTSSSSNGNIRSANDAQQIVQKLWQNYVDRTAQRVKLLDTFLAFLIVVGVLQFAYCVLAGNYPFNAFLSGFSATVGQFVLTISLRLQTNPENKAEFTTISHERAFADFVFGSMILHFFCINFIN